MKLSELIGQIKIVDSEIRNEASKAVNRMLTLRNWLIGYYLVQYEQQGEDRASYGDRLLENIASELSTENVKGMSAPELSRYRQFFTTYIEIGNQLSGLFSNVLPILGTLPQNFSTKTETSILGSLSQESGAKSVPAEQLVSSLSFSHFVELIKISEPRKRVFYEIECIKGTWSVRELKRQINSLYYERSGLSKSPQALRDKTKAKTTPQLPTALIKDVYAFEFLGLPFKDAVEESDLETSLLDHLREFILELGNGFCLEARQKRILIGDEYYFVDLVFYHRLLKCHVLVELKIEEFSHANAGQLNTYLNYYKHQVKQESDNDPIGILLVTHKNQALVQYATAGMDQNLFVSKYLLRLPAASQLEDFINKELKTL